MGVKNVFSWYQKKIGTCDKQKWETTVENKILFGLTHIQMKSTKPNTDFIDLDLVRGSPFQKSKPKQSVFTIARLATLRCFLLPLYLKWWMQQTSVAIFLVMFFVYFSLLVNIAIYVTTIQNNITSDKRDNIIFMELVIPTIMLWVLSVLHSQISATMPNADPQKSKLSNLSKFKKTLRRRFSTARTHVASDGAADSRFTFDLNNVKKNISYDLNSSINNKVQTVGLPVKSVRFRKMKSKHNIDDDGFESLNGNCSRTSDEETPLGKNILFAQRRRCNDWVKKTRPNEEDKNSDNSDDEQRHSSDEGPKTLKNSILRPKRNKYRQIPQIDITSVDSTCDTEDECIVNKANKDASSSNHEWMNVTTNSEDCSYSSDLEEVSDVHGAHIESSNNVGEHDFGQANVYNSPTIKVSCIVWKRGEVKKAELTMLDISSAIIGKVESPSQSMDYLYIGIVISTINALIPILFRLCNSMSLNANVDSQFSIFELSYTEFINKLPNTMISFMDAAFGSTIWERIIISTACLHRWFLANLFFFLLAVAENTFKQRFLYAKLFTHLTSFRRSQQSALPHFRLNKVRNIKTWLSVRSNLKQRGPQRSVDVIVSTAFIITLLLLSFLCVELLKETGALNTQYHVEALILCIGVGILLLQFMTLGNKINKKYRNLSVLITEQINLHLQIEQKPQKKDELALANNVLKLAIDLIKELQSPFKISGLSANSILYNTTKLIILSALSGILSELLGFKLKLHKLKIK